ncbi:MAG: acyltransferase [Rubrivivax sp.]|nr:acyltransferase [Rubrivivax sp.]
MNHIRHIDSLRALAVLAVLLYHARPQWLPGGFLGVDVFFAISGFVVTGSLARHGAQSIGSFIGGFYFRRLTRILPALLVVLVVTSLAWTLLIPHSWLSGQAERIGLYAFAGLSNWALMDQADAYFAPRAEFSPFTHTWSLGVEEQFYLVAPWIIFWAWRARRFAVALLSLLAVASLVAAIAWTAVQPTLAFYSVFSRFWELAAGSVWYLLVWQRGVGRRWFAGASRQLAGRLIALLLLAITLGLASPTGTPFPWAIGAVVGTLILIGHPDAPAAQVPRIMVAPALRWVGLRSYSLYLWHWPVFVFMRWTIGLEAAWCVIVAGILSFAAAAFSYRWIEQPLRTSPRWLTLPAWPANLGSIAVAGLAAWSASMTFAHRHELSLSLVERHSIDWYPVHHDPSLPPLACPGGGLRYRPMGDLLVIEHHPCAGAVLATPTRRLFVLGDSHATAYLGLLDRLSREESVEVSVYQIPGCPFVDLMAPMGTGRPPGCLTLPRAALADLASRAQPGDVVLMASLRLPRFGDQWGNLPDEAVLTQHFSAAQAEQRRAAIVDADRWIQPLLRQGLKVVLAAPTPIFRAPPFRCVDGWTRHNPVCVRGLSEARANEQAFRAPVVQALKDVVARQDAPSITLWDPFDALCPGQHCLAVDAAGRPNFFDGDHVSRWGNEVAYPSFHSHWRCVTTGSACGVTATATAPR